MPDEVSQPGAKESQEEDKLRAFLVSIGTDPCELGRFIKDPDATMNRAGLSAEDQWLLKSGNPAAINSRLTGRASAPPAAAVLLVVDVAADGKTPSIRASLPGAGPAFMPQPAPAYRQPWTAQEQIQPVRVPVAYFPQQAVYPQPGYPGVYQQPWTAMSLIPPVRVGAVHFPDLPYPWGYQPFYHW